MAIAGALIGGALGSFGTKPIIPDLPNIDPSQIQLDTTKGNAAALPGATALAAGIDQFNLDQLSKALSFWSPGGLDKIRSRISSQLSGEIDPTDTAALISSATAAGYGKGFNFGNGGIGKNLVLKDLGLGVEATKQQGMQNLMSLKASGPAPFDVSSMFFTPQQRLSFSMADRTARFNRDLMANQVAAAPDPATAALGQEIDRFFNTVAAAGMMAAGGAMGGGGASGGGGETVNASSLSNAMKGGVSGGWQDSGGSAFGTARGQGVALGQSNLNGSSNWQAEFGNIYGLS